MTQTYTLYIGLALVSGVLLFALTAPLQSEAHTGVRSHAHASSTATSTSERDVVDRTCVQTALETREDALYTAWDTFAEIVGTSLEVRKTALTNAWGLTDRSARNRALVAAWKEWRTDSKAAHKELRNDRKEAWDAYRHTMRTSCRTEIPRDEALGRDLAGEIAL